MKEEKRKKIIIAISGATGFVYGVRLMKILKKYNCEIHLVVSKSAELTRSYETKYSSQEVKKLADYYYKINDIGSRISSGSFLIDAMVIAPCSVKTLAEIANGIGSNLISRAADVCLKERRKLILLLRESPFNLIHIENMKQLTLAGGIIATPVPSFYNNPQNIDDIINDTVHKITDILGFDFSETKRWNG